MIYHLDNADAGPQSYLLSLNFKQPYYTTTLIDCKLATLFYYDLSYSNAMCVGFACCSMNN